MRTFAAIIFALCGHLGIAFLLLLWKVMDR